MKAIKKLLFLSPQLPYPPISGGVIKSWRLVEFLSTRYQLSVATFLKNDEALHQSEFLSKVKLCDYYFEPIDVPRTAGNLIKSNLLLQPLNLYRNRSKGFKKNIQKLIAESDAIFVDHYEMFQYVPSKYHGKIILHQHNCEYLIWDRFAAIENNIFKKIALKNQAFWIRNYERKICKKSHTILAAPNDIQELVQIGADSSKFYKTYHLGNENLLHLPPLQWQQSEDSILFIGTLSWEANVDSVLYFIQDIWPLLTAQKPNLKFYIIGKNPDARIIELAQSQPNIILTGFVTDLDEYYSRCKVFVSPLRFGSGIKVKVMDALYRGIPTVTTAVGAEGLAVQHRESMMIADHAQDFAEQVLELMQNQQLWEQLATQSRQLAHELYTWQAVFEKVIQAIEN